MVLTNKDVPKYAAEFLASYLLVLTIGCNVLGGISVWAVTSIAAVALVMLYSVGAISGAHFNPAVTLSVALSNKMPGGWHQAFVYMVMQVLGGTVGALTYLFMFKASFDITPGKGHTWIGAGIVEAIYTFFICFVVLNTACSSASKDNQYFGLAISFVIIAAGYAIGAISGGVINPAVGLGVDLASIHKGFGYSIVYMVFQLVGACGAALLFRVVRPEDFGGEPRTLVARLTAEFVGTFLLTLTVGLNVLNGSAAAPWSIGACLLAVVYALGNVSGAHVNPAVTLAIYLSGRAKITAQDALYYVAVQVVAAMVAAFVYVGVMGMSFPLVPALGWINLGIAEVNFTFLLCFVVLSVATVQQPSKDLYGLAIGSVITAAGFAAGSLGITMNPAVSVGIDFGNMLKGGRFGTCFPYGIFECMGAGLAAGAFMLLRPEEYAKVDSKATV